MNHLQTISDQIYKFSLGNTYHAKEFCIALQKQALQAFEIQWSSREELESYIFSDHDVLAITCSEDECNFDYLQARDLQHSVVNIISDFYDLE